VCSPKEKNKNKKRTRGIMKNDTSFEVALFSGLDLILRMK